MKKIKVTFLGEELNIVFNMGVQIGYEDIIGKPFDILTVGQTAASRAALYQAAIITGNPDKKFDFDKILEHATFRDLDPVDKAVAECMTEFFGIPVLAEQHVPEPTEEEKEDPKNV